MAKKLNGRTVAGIHEQLIGTKMVIDGWNCTIDDTTETETGIVFYAVRVQAAQAIYLEQKWFKYNA